MSKEVEETLGDYDADEEQAGEEQPIEPSGQGDEYFAALCGTLPADVQKAYRRYGDNFKTGYLALNQGDFVVAARQLYPAGACHSLFKPAKAPGSSTAAGNIYRRPAPGVARLPASMRNLLGHRRV
jgi:hypothetical protein